MLRRLAVLPACFLMLTAFTDGQKKELAAACADSLIKRQERGQETPKALVANRTPICACVADAVADEGEIPDGDKPKVTRIFALVAAGDMEGRPGPAPRPRQDGPHGDAPDHPRLRERIREAGGVGARAPAILPVSS